MADGLDASSAEICWPLDDTTVDGTLCRPGGPGPFPGAVLVAGSGPTDRDWNSPLLPGGNGSGRLLAEALLQAGIASLRFDKRGVGPHARQNLQAIQGRVSMESHRAEVGSAVARLAACGFVRPGRIFAIANSEGTLHVLHHQISGAEPAFAGLVLLAPPGRPVGAVARAQLAAQAAGVPGGQVLLALYDAAIGRFLAGRPATPDPALPEPVRALVQSLEAPINLPFARELWAADAAALLPRVTVPLLVVIGRRDIQVDWRADGEPLRRAAAGLADATFLFPEHANHVLKHEPLPLADVTAAAAGARYNSPEAQLDAEALAGILGWLAQRA